MKKVALGETFIGILLMILGIPSIDDILLMAGRETITNLQVPLTPAFLTLFFLFEVIGIITLIDSILRFFDYSLKRAIEDIITYFSEKSGGY